MIISYGYSDVIIFRSSEPYDDGKLSLEFKDFVAFEKKKVIPTSIITAWGSHLNEDVEGRLPKSHICLPTIESVRLVSPNRFPLKN